MTSTERDETMAERRKMWAGVALLVALALAAAAARAASAEEDYRAGEKAYLGGDVIGAMAALRRAAETGHAPAQALLAEILDRAQFTQEALALYRKAAEQGNADGQFGLGVMYLAGESVRADRREALLWLTRAAEQDHEAAIRALARALLQPPAGEPGDSELVRRWVSRAAQIGDIAAMERLAAAYAGGELGLAADPVQAKLWSERAAEAKKRQAGPPPARKRRS